MAEETITVELTLTPEKAERLCHGAPLDAQERKAVRAALVTPTQPDHPVEQPRCGGTKSSDEELPEWASIYSYLCGNCGEIRPADQYGYFIHDNEGRFGPEGALVPAPKGETPDVDRCPACGFDHEDNDTGPGAWSGTRAEMETERAQLLTRDSFDWGGTWMETWRELATPPEQPAVPEHVEDAVGRSRHTKEGQG